MGELKLKRSEDINISEKELQELFEKNLGSLGEWGLRYVTSYVPIGTGIIDILAVDDQNNAVIIECKKIGEGFDKDALIQLMRYYSWFEKDPNHILYLKAIVKKVLPNVEINTEPPTLMAIVKDIEDDIKTACWAVGTDVLIVSYEFIKGENGDFIVIPKVELDTSFEEERLIREPKTEADHFKNREHMKPVYDKLLVTIKELVKDFKINPAPQGYIGLIKRRGFGDISIKSKCVRLTLYLPVSEAKVSQRYRPHSYYKDTVGYIDISSLSEIDQEVIKLIKMAYDRAE